MLNFIKLVLKSVFKADTVLCIHLINLHFDILFDYGQYSNGDTFILTSDS